MDPAVPKHVNRAPQSDQSVISRASRANEAIIKGAEIVSKASEYAEQLSSTISDSADAVSPFMTAMLEAAPTLASAWSATSSLLEAIADAPMVGPAVKLLLLFARAITTVAGFEGLVARAKCKVADFAQALRDIDDMIPPGATPTKTLQTWLDGLRSTLQVALDENALRTPGKPTFVMRLLCAVKGAVFDAERIETVLADLETKW